MTVHTIDEFVRSWEATSQATSPDFDSRPAFL